MFFAIRRSSHVVAYGDYGIFPLIGGEILPYAVYGDLVAVKIAVKIAVTGVFRTNLQVAL